MTIKEREPPSGRLSRRAWAKRMRPPIGRRTMRRGKPVVIDRLFYAAVIAALLGVLVFDPTFFANLFRAFGEPTAISQLGIWEVSVASILATLIVVAIVMERRP